jgi:hypothetical protein
MNQISPRDFSKLNADINSEIEKVLLKFVADGKIKVIPDGKPLKSSTDSEQRKRGRPRKVQTNEKIERKEKRPRGRPRKVKTAETKSVNGAKRKRRKKLQIQDLKKSD